jgi:hypothetical protein
MTLTIVGLVLAGAAVFLALRFHHSRPSKPEFKTLEEMMQYLAGEAVKMASENRGVRLDYTPASIEKVDQVLGNTHEEYQRTRSTQGIQGLAMAYGAYIGEVIRRSEPGARWERGDSVGGENSYPMLWRGGSSYVCAWCYRRITNGDEDNVWHKYIAIRDGTWKTPSAKTVQ